MADEYVGSVILELDGQEIDITSVEPSETTGRQIVKTMNRTGRPKGYSKGMADYTLRISVPVSYDEKVDWAAVTNAKLTIFPLDDEGQRTSYLDCFSTEVGESYPVEGESRRDITLMALRKVVE